MNNDKDINTNILRKDAPLVTMLVNPTVQYRSWQPCTGNKNLVQCLRKYNSFKQQHRKVNCGQTMFASS